MACKLREVTNEMAVDRLAQGVYILETNHTTVGISDENRKLFVNFTEDENQGKRFFLIHTDKLVHLIYPNDSDRYLRLLEGKKPTEFKIERI